MKPSFTQSLAALVVAAATGLFCPAQLHADATASGQLSFANLSVTPGAGSLVVLTNWSGAAYAQATVSNQFNTGSSTAAGASGDYSLASASANGVAVSGSSSASGSILGVLTASDTASAQASLASWFMITGGSGDVNAIFSAQLNGSLSVLTDAYGELALAETVFTLEVSGDAVLFDHRFYSIGPADSASASFSQILGGAMTLQYNTPYLLLAQADAEISISNVPEPGTFGLAAAGALALLWLGRKKKLARMKAGLSVLLTFGACGISQATYIGADAPATEITSQQGGTVLTSLTEGNLREDYPVATVWSSGTPMLDLSLNYNSYDADGSRAQIDSGLGLGWTHSYNSFLFQQRSAFFKMGSDGRVTKYKFSTGGYIADLGYFETLTAQPDGSYIITNKLRDWWRFASIPGTQLLVEGPVWRLTQQGDRNGNITTLAYSNGLLSSVTDTYGRAITFGYTNRHVAIITDPLGRTTQFQYDPKFRTPTRITDPQGRVTRYTYNGLYQMTKKIDRDNRTYFYLYRYQKPWAVVDGDGQTWFALVNSNKWAVDRDVLSLQLRRSYMPSTVTNIDGRGNAWRYQYDTNGYITRSITPDGATTSYAYDGLTRKVRVVTNANGFVTRYQYDSNGNRTNVTDALGQVTRYTYEPLYNQMISETDPLGRTTTYQYDSRGNRTNETDPLSQHRSWTYDSHGNMLTETDKNGHTTTYIYDSVGNRTNRTDALGNVTRYTYDGVGNLIRTTDRLGRETAYVYDSRNRLIATTNALGGVSSSVYDGVGRQTTNSDALGRTTTYQYDTRGRLTRTTDPVGGVTSYGYDGSDNRIATTNQLGNPTTYQYDTQNRLTTQADSLGNTTTFTYDPEGNRTSMTDRNGHSTTYTYDGLDRRITETDPLGNVTRYDYSPSADRVTGAGIVTRAEDANGHVTFYQYDGMDRLTREVRKQGNTNVTITPSDAVTTNAYDPVGNRISVTDPVGNRTVYTYDALNRLVVTTNAAADVTTTTYDAEGNVLTQTSPNGRVTTYTYDGLDRRTSAYDGVGLLTTNIYDPVGNRVSTTDADGHTTTYTYDGLDRRTVEVDALGNPSITTYDGVGNVITNIDRNGNVTRYDYDTNDRRTSQVDRLGNTTTFAYDAEGNVTNVTDANGRVTTYTYDADDRRVTEVYPNPPPNTVTFTYDAVGNVITRTDQKGQVTTYSYSELNYRTNRSYTPSGVSEHFIYDLSGRLLSADRSGWVTTYTYDGADRMLSSTQNGQVLTYDYDIAGRRQTNTYPSGRVIRQTTDERSRLLTEREGISPPIVTYTYDAADRVITRNHRNGTTTTYTYDADNRITSLEHSNSVGRVAGFAYDYDFEGNRLTELKRHATVDSEAYQYDAMDRLVDYRVGTISGLTIPSPALEKLWNLDALGNWVNLVSNLVVQTRTHGPANELLTLNAQTFSYDFDGNLVQDTLYNYAYDEENRLTQVQRISDSAIVGRYYYDAFGRRVVAIANPAGISTTNVFYYDGERIVEEQDATGVTQATYVYGNYLDEVLTMDRAGQTYYYHQNSLWSPHALTDPGGNVVERYTYDAYGEVIVLDAGYSPLALNAWGTPHSAVGNPYLYTGRELDEEGGLYFYRARYYDAVKGRFLQRDPVGYVDGLNLYEYVLSNPVGRIDPSGMKALTTSELDEMHQLFQKLYRSNKPDRRKVAEILKDEKRYFELRNKFQKEGVRFDGQMELEQLKKIVDNISPTLPKGHPSTGAIKAYSKYLSGGITVAINGLAKIDEERYQQYKRARDSGASHDDAWTWERGGDVALKRYALERLLASLR